MPEFAFQTMFPQSKGDTPYRLLTTAGVELDEFRGERVLRVDRGALTRLAAEAVRDISHLFRPGHLAQLAKILDDPEATENDRFVARTMLQNACVSAGMVLPSCQDTGTAIVMGKKGQQVWTHSSDGAPGGDEEALARGIFQTYTETNLRYSQVVPITTYEEVNTGTNLPAQIDLMAVDGDEYHFLVMTKGGGSANKTFLFQETKALLNPDSLMKFVGEKIKTLGTSACPPYHLAIVIGGTSAEMNLKTVKLGPDDRASMQQQLGRDDLSFEDRFHFHFALGKAFEDAGDYESSFSHYAQGNALRREIIAYDPAENTSHVQRSKIVLTRELFAARRGVGCQAADPIFIVGLPRAGSTLIEQILASHPLVEGTQELPDLAAIARELGGKKVRTEASRYPEILADLGESELRELGERYLARTRIQRKTDAPFFIDKLPNNWAHVGLIHLILPNAKIIDARRHPLGCCFSGFKQHFARGQHFTYDLADIGRYYRDYVELMAHFDAVLPGRVHRAIYEHVVENTEAEVRRLLDYCGLEFDERCLRFYENDRAVRTASSEQVRRPIFREGVDHWRHYERWLDPLKAALGDVLDRYPDVPDFAKARAGIAS